MSRFSLCYLLVVSFSAKVENRAAYNISQTCLLHKSCKLPCRIVDYQKNDTVVWLNEKKTLTRGTHVYVHDILKLRIEKHAANEWNLHTENVTRQFEGIYVCKQNGIDGHTLSEIRVVIESKPKLIEGSSSTSRTEFNESEEAELKCVFEGLPVPKIKWYRGRLNEIIEGLEGSKLKIRNVTRYANNNYTCKATNKHGYDVKEMTLAVKFAPDVLVMTSLIHATENDYVVMRCVVQALPLNHAYWSYKGERLKSNHIYKITEDIETDEFPMRLLELKIELVNQRDQGNYTCHGGRNDITKTATVQLIIDD